MTQQKEATVEIEIYIAEHCIFCEYAREVADMIRREYPEVAVCLIDMATTDQEIPENVFATPTYLLNGRVWSLGNPSPDKVDDTLCDLVGRPTSA